MNRSDRSFRALRKLALACFSLFLCLPVFTAAAGAQSDEPDEVVIFVLDLSGSMNEPFDGNRTKLDVAKAAFSEAFANVSPDALVGLRTYGDQIAATEPAGRLPSCTEDTRLVTPIAPLQRDQLISQVQSFTALGDTPMGLALSSASSDIPEGSVGTIVLFSDGRDECFDADLDGDPASGPSFGENPCEIAKAVAANENGRVDRVVTVGFGADAAAESELRCIADSTGGSYTAIETPEDARDVLPELLVQLSAPREAQRLAGSAIVGTPSATDAPDLLRLDEANAERALYTDSIAINKEKWYRLSEFGPESGTFTATVFGLPAEPDITFDLRLEVPELRRDFFAGEHGDIDAGLPLRPTASIRCTDCSITGNDPFEVFWVLSLKSSNSAVVGEFELEIVTEGQGFGGPPTSCSQPEECWYPTEIERRTEQLATLGSQVQDLTGGRAPQALIDERDALIAQSGDAQAAVQAADERAAQLEALIPTAPVARNSWRIPLFMLLGGIGLAFAPLQRLKKGDEDGVDPDGVDEDGVDTANAPTPSDPANGESVGTDDKKKGKKRRKKADKAAGDVTVPAEVDPGPRTLSADVGKPVPPPNKVEGNPWDAELEAAKEAMAGQMPSRPEADVAATTAATPPPSDEAERVAAELEAAKEALAMARLGGAQEASEQRIAEDDAASAARDAALQQAQAAEAAAHAPAPAQADPGAQFTAEQHAAAQAAAQQIAAQRAAETQAAEQAAQQQAAQAQAAQAQAAEHAAQQQAQQQAAQAQAAEQAAQQQAAPAQEPQSAAPVQAEPGAQFTAEQHAAAQAAAQQIAAQRAAEAQAAQQPAAQAQPTQTAVTQAHETQATSPPGTPPPGWYDDPSSPGRFRWWDGTGWTNQISADGKGNPS